MLHRPISRSVLLLVALYTAAGGYVHLQEWLNGYRDIPSSVPGSWVVRIGFPLNAAAAAVFTIALIVAAVRRRGGVPIVLASIGLNLSTLGIVIATRMTSVFGWTEPVWTPGANQARAVAIGAVAMAFLALAATTRPLLAARRPLAVS